MLGFVAVVSSRKTEDEKGIGSLSRQIRERAEGGM